MATIYDIAKLCGISPATVSKALSNATDVSAATRERVRRVASELNYIPDSRAKSLSRNRSWSLGILCQDGSDMGLRHYLFAGIIESFKHEVERMGYDVSFVSNHVGSMGLSFLGHCRYRKVDGVFIVNADAQSADVQELLSSDLPKITFDYSDERVGSVTTDSYTGMTLLYNHLHELGHRNIVYMHGEGDKFITNERITAFKRSAEACGDRVDDDSFIESAYYSIPAGKEAMRKLLMREQTPTAVICSDDYTALGAIDAIHEAGLTVPEDISICGYDGIEITQLISPQLTTIKQDTEEIGRTAAESLMNQIHNRNIRYTGKMSITPQLIIGQSCSQPRKDG